MLRPLACLVLLAFACSPTTAPSPQPPTPPPPRAEVEPDRPPEIAPDAEPATDAPIVEATPSAGGITARFAESALSPLARQLVALTDAAVHGRPLPAADFPIERYDADDSLVRGDRVDVAQMEVVAFAMEVNVAIERLKFAPGPGQPTSLNLVFFLSEHGLKTLSIEPSHATNLPPPPAWLPIEKLGGEIVDDLKKKRFDRWLVGDQELSMLGPEVAKDVEDDRLRAADAAKLKSVVANAGKVTGARLDDVEMLARDGRGMFWLFKLGFESGTSIELDSHPLVRVKRNPK